MQCLNEQCSKLVTLIYQCLTCKKEFCSDRCVKIHESLHRNNDYLLESIKNTDNVIVNLIDNTSNCKLNKTNSDESASNSLVQSIFLKNGTYMKDIILIKNTLFDFTNFEFIKLGADNHIIGAGSYGEVLLSKNKQNKKFYAIKKV